jgi:putative addiction module killer protein
MEVRITESFDKWLQNVKDKPQKIIVKRIRNMERGTLGEVKSLDEGLFEAKIRYGPGYRLYFINNGKEIILLLCGGEKKTQTQDIKTARKMAKEFKK